MRLSIDVGNVTLTLHLPRLEVQRTVEYGRQTRGVGLARLVQETRAVKPGWRAADARAAERALAFDLHATQQLPEMPEPANFCAPVSMATIPILEV